MTTATLQRAHSTDGLDTTQHAADTYGTPDSQFDITMASGEFVEEVLGRSAADTTPVPIDDLDTMFTASGPFGPPISDFDLAGTHANADVGDDIVDVVGTSPVMTVMEFGVLGFDIFGPAVVVISLTRGPNLGRSPCDVCAMRGRCQFGRF